MRKNRAENVEEDVTGQGGWLFADSFLALAVVFLATISFVPPTLQGSGGTVSGINSGDIGTIAGMNYVKGLNLAYDTFDAAKIQSDIAAFIASEKLSPNTSVLYAKVIGGYDKATETAEDGQLRGLLFSINLRKANLSYIADTKFDLGATELIEPTQVVLRMTLSPKS